MTRQLWQVSGHVRAHRRQSGNWPETAFEEMSIRAWWTVENLDSAAGVVSQKGAYGPRPWSSSSFRVARNPREAVAQADQRDCTSKWMSVVALT